MADMHWGLIMWQGLFWHLCVILSQSLRAENGTGWTLNFYAILTASISKGIYWIIYLDSQGVVRHGWIQGSKGVIRTSFLSLSAFSIGFILKKVLLILFELNNSRG